MDPDDLLADAALDAAVGALAARNAHHLERMDASEQAEAAATWRELAVDVLTAARSTLRGELPAQATPAAGPGPHGRAVVVFEDAGGSDVSVHAAFHPELSQVDEEQVAGTPAQLAALTFLQQIENQAAG